MKKIIIASHKKDGTSLFLLKKIKEKRIPVTLINLADFPEKISMSYSVKNNLLDNFNFRLPNNKILSSEDISGVWWRRPYGITKNKVRTTLDNYIKIESDVMINSFFNLVGDINTTWVSNPLATQTANLKPLQLKIANQLELRIPKTCISNDPSIVKLFVNNNLDISLIVKPVGNSFVRLSVGREKTTKKDRVIFTRITPHEKILLNLEMIHCCPVIIQEAFIKDYDIRVTVVGDQIFSAQISTDIKPDNGLLDWRYFSAEKYYKYHKLPDSVAEKCISLTKMLGLKFGAIDLGFSEKDGYCFFEINPQGQWLPSELKAGLPISGALIDLLSKNL